MKPKNLITERPYPFNANWSIPMPSNREIAEQVVTKWHGNRLMGVIRRPELEREIAAALDKRQAAFEACIGVLRQLRQYELEISITGAVAIDEALALAAEAEKP